MSTSGLVLLLPIACLAALSVLLVSPVGDFPLNDDWIFAKEVHTLLTTGRYVANPFSSPMVVAQTLWGTAFAAAFGFNYSVLRVSTLVLAVLAAWGTAKSARELGATHAASVLAGMTLFCGPIFLNLAYSYNTDVPFLAPVAWSIFFFLRALRTGRAREVFLGSALAAVAFFIRQFGVLVPTAFALTLCLGFYRRQWPMSRTTLLALASPWLAAAAIAAYLSHISEAHYTWNAATRFGDTYVRIIEDWQYLVKLLAYIGLFSMPLAIARLYQTIVARAWARRRWITFSVVTLAIAGTLHSLVGMRILPMLGNNLKDLGTGVVTFRNISLPVDLDWQVVHLGNTWWTAITIVAVISAGVVLTELLRALVSPEPARPDTRWRVLFLALCGALFCGVLLLPYVPGRFDRYILPAVIPAVLIVAGAIQAGQRSKSTYMIAGVLCAVCFAFSLVCVQDYLAWNRARWSGIRWLLDEKHVDPFEIDAGYEYQGIYTSAEYARRHNKPGFWEHGLFDWWVLGDTYAVTFWPRDGYDEIRRQPYSSYLGRIEPGANTPWYRKSTRYVLILQRQEASPPAAQIDGFAPAD